MTDPTDSVVWRAFTRSVIVRAIERVAGAIEPAGADSRFLVRARHWSAAAAAHPGPLLLSAGLTHIALMVVVARPVSWIWAILPLIVVAIGAVLIVFSRPARMER
jgi:hypothetical protein